MNSGFASEMINAIDSLTNSFSSFTGGTITGGTWEGDAAENAKNQVTQKIDPKAEAAKKNIEELDRCIAEVKSSDADESAKQKKISEYTSKKEDFKKEYDAAVEKVKSLCGK